MVKQPVHRELCLPSQDSSFLLVLLSSQPLAPTPQRLRLSVLALMAPSLPSLARLGQVRKVMGGLEPHQKISRSKREVCLGPGVFLDTSSSSSSPLVKPPSVTFSGVPSTVTRLSVKHLWANL